MEQNTTAQNAQPNENVTFDFPLLVDLTRQLTDIVRQETALLRAMKISDLREFQSAKHNISSALEKQQDLIKGNAEIRDSLSPDQKSTLRMAAGEFDEALQQYQRELLKAQSVNQLVMEKIMEAMKEHVEKNQPYNGSGNRNLSGTELARNTPAMKFNQQI